MVKSEVSRTPDLCGRWPTVVERQVTFQALLSCADGLIGAQKDLFVFEAFPESFDKHVIPPIPFSIHADPDAVVRQESRELLVGELVALIGVEDGGVPC